MACLDLQGATRGADGKVPSPLNDLRSPMDNTQAHEDTRNDTETNAAITAPANPLQLQVDTQSSTLRADQANQSQYGYYYAPGKALSSHTTPSSHYPIPSTAWGHPWPPDHSSASTSGGIQYYAYSQSHAASHPMFSNIAHVPTVNAFNEKQGTSCTSRSPSPPPPQHWDSAIRAFLLSAGFTQALRGFDADMVVMNSEWERRKVPAALDNLVQNILELKERSIDASADERDEAAAENTLLEDRKLQYLHLADGIEPKSQTSITRDISKFLARNRARNDASNRQEFLLSTVEKRHGLQTGNHDSTSVPPSCARVDAKTQNRDVQMKYDIAKNEDGPLRKTLKACEDSPTAIPDRRDLEQNYISAARFPALDERIRNVESHLAVRYVPSPPRSLLDRLRFLEDHIVQLEKEYPPWAALHFNQPRRGWPPPPRPTPIIVPSHLTSTISHEVHPGSSQAHSQSTAVSTSAAVSGSEISEPTSTKGKGKSGRTKSSLHRAVMEKLEVQRAMHDLADSSDGV